MTQQPQHLTLAQAAALIGRSERFVSNLRERGYLNVPAPGQYPLVGLVRGVLAHFEDQIAKQAQTAGQTAATDARTREIELRIERKAAALIPAHIPTEVIDEMVALASAEMRKIPARLYRDRPRRAELREVIEGSVARITKQGAAAKAALIEGKP